MKKNKIVAWTAALLGLWGCGEGGINGTEPGFEQGQGKVQLTLEPGAAIVISKASTTVDVAGFGVKMVTEQGKEAYNNSSYSEVPKDLALEAGNYVLMAANNGVQKGAAFERPYYAGSTTFSVKVGEVTPVKVLCELKSTGIEVTYTDKMLAELTDIWVSVVGGDGANLTYYPTERRTGWFSIPESGKITITVGGLRGGVPIYNSQDLSSVAAKELRRIKLDIKTSGSSETLIEIDEKIVRKDVTIAIPDADDVIDNNGDNGSWEEGGEPEVPATGPTIIGKSWEGNAFDIGKTVTINPNTIKILDVLMSSSAADGLQNLWLEIDSELLKEPLAGLFGITGPIDLANPEANAAWLEAFVDLGIIDPASPIKGKTEHLFSVGGLLSMLGPVDPTGGTPHRFKLKVIDANGTTEKVLTIVLDYQ